MALELESLNKPKTIIKKSNISQHAKPIIKAGSLDSIVTHVNPICNNPLKNRPAYNLCNPKPPPTKIKMTIKHRLFELLMEIPQFSHLGALLEII